MLLIQGQEDPVFSAASQQRAMQVLKEIGAPAQAHILTGLEHSIDDRGLQLAGELIRSVTGA